MHVAVIGGGISGIRAALTLARAGRRVTLFEKNRHLGGRVFSFPTAEFGEIDIGQHVWLKCCTALEALLRDLAVPDEWVYRQRAFALRYKRPGAADFVFGSSPLPTFGAGIGAAVAIGMSGAGACGFSITGGWVAGGWGTAATVPET